MNENEKTIDQTKEESAWERMDRLEQLLKQKDQEKAEEEKKYIIKAAQQAEEIVKERNIRQKAERAKELAEYNYVNQQKAYTEGTKLVAGQETSPERKVKMVFYERLKARCEKAQKMNEAKQDNVYYL